MSTILKALRRLEEERQGARQRDLRREVASEVHQRSRDADAARHTAASWLGAGCGVVAALVGVWYFAGGLRPVVPESPPVEIRVSPADPAAEVVTVWTKQPRVVPPPVAASPPAPAAIETLPDRPSTESPAAPKDPWVPPANARSFAVVRPDPIPELRIWKTVWHPNASRRLAVVEVAGEDGPVELREGEALGSLVVTEITPAGVTFERDGVQWVRRLGENSPATRRGR